MANTSVAWWERTKTDATRLHAWLYDQYRGEVTAASRIEALRDKFAAPGHRAYRLLTVIASQEREHARWVGELLATRGLAVEVQDKTDRYWRTVVPEIESLETGAAVGAHAETMRLERIEAIAADPTAPSDVRGVFAKILPQERFHARAFASLTTPEAMARTANAHALGRAALGLVA
jgi:hypothetical protein